MRTVGQTTTEPARRGQRASGALRSLLLALIHLLERPVPNACLDTTMGCLCMTPPGYARYLTQAVLVLVHPPIESPIDREIGGPLSQGEARNTNEEVAAKKP